jgi:hypothetical protein
MSRVLATTKYTFVLGSTLTAVYFTYKYLYWKPQPDSPKTQSVVYVNEKDSVIYVDKKFKKVTVTCGVCGSKIHTAQHCTVERGIVGFTTNFGYFDKTPRGIEGALFKSTLLLMYVVIGNVPSVVFVNKLNSETFDGKRTDPGVAQHLDRPFSIKSERKSLVHDNKTYRMETYIETIFRSVDESGITEREKRLVILNVRHSEVCYWDPEESIVVMIVELRNMQSMSGYENLMLVKYENLKNYEIEPVIMRTFEEWHDMSEKKEQQRYVKSFIT